MSGKKKCFLFKVDFAKAYDSISWSFLEFVMAKMGFSPVWRKWMMECVSSATISVLVNGSPTNEFGLSRGSKQGNTLSPFLFIMVVEGLSVMMA